VTSRKTALTICAKHFPAGPEELASRLKISVCRSPLQGVEGWCIRGANTVIRINSSSSNFRQRFTLAHELAHLVLGTEPDIATEPFRSNSQEEREADQLASEFLIPKAELDRYLRGALPVDAKTLVRLAKAANVSPVMAACRVVSATEELGLHNAAVVFFKEAKEIWRFSHGLVFDRGDVEHLLGHALACAPNLVREQNHDGNIVVGSLIDAQVYQVLLVQLLAEETAAQETREERLRLFASRLFGEDRSFQQSVAGVLGIVRQKCEGQTLDAAIAYFDSKYLGTKYTGAQEKKLRGPGGRAYVRLRLEQWFN
jgi:hypothetical protein